MKIFCTNRVKKDIEKLEKKPSYSNLRSLLFNYMSKKKTTQDWMEGTRIFLGNPNFICVKKRLGGSGGYRMYHLITINEDEVTIAALYPKTGSKGGSDLTDDGKTSCIGEALDQISEKNRWEIVLDTNPDSLSFKLEEKVKVNQI